MEYKYEVSARLENNRREFIRDISFVMETDELLGKGNAKKIITAMAPSSQYPTKISIKKTKSIDLIGINHFGMPALSVREDTPDLPIGKCSKRDKPRRKRAKPR